jgi:peptidoglycan/LPS O-acetylase OafA/YrhL
MTAEAERGHDRYPCLDGVRAIAVTLVFLFHGGLGSRWMVRHAGDYIVHFNIGVEIFFVLSGFLIYLPFVRANLFRTRPVSVRNYLLRRGLRIYPAYLLAVFALLVLDDIEVNGASGVLKHATLTYSYFRDLGGLGIAQSWTLVIEVSFYAFVPLWALIMRAASHRLRALHAELAGALVLIAIGYVASAFLFYGSPAPPLTVLPPGFGALGAGMLLAVLCAASSGDERLAARLNGLGRFPVVWWAAAAVLYVYLAWRPYGFLGSTPGQLMWDRALKIPIALFLVVPAVFGDQQRGTLRRILSAAPIAYLGLVSYGIYLWHARITSHIATDDALNHHGTLFALGALVLAYGATVAVASASYFVLERPALRLARGSRRTARAPSGAARR